MVDGETGGHLENAVLPVEMERENARVPAPIPPPPPPSGGGADCTGPSTDTEACNNGPCAGKRPKLMVI